MFAVYSSISWSGPIDEHSYGIFRRIWLRADVRRVCFLHNHFGSLFFSNLFPNQSIESDPADSPSSLSSSSSSSMKRKGNLNKMSRTKPSPIGRTPSPPETTTTSTTTQQNRSVITKTTSDISHTPTVNEDQRQPALPGGTRRNGTVVGAKRGSLKGARKSFKGTDKCARTSKSGGRFRAQQSEGEEIKSGRSNGRLSTSAVATATQQSRRRPPVDGARRTRRSSSSASSVTSWTRGTAAILEEAPRRRVAAVNGTLLMMVAARAQRSNSSASASSCSLHSMEGDATNDEVEEVEDSEDRNVDCVVADESSHSIASSTTSSRNAAASRSSSSQRRTARSRLGQKSSKSGRSGTADSTSVSSHPLANTAASSVACGSVPRVVSVPNSAHTPDTTRTKKPKRAAALAASAATAASATVGAKRPRVGSKRAGTDEAKRRRHIRDRSGPRRCQTEDELVTENEDNLLIDEESARATDDASSEITSLSKSESSTAFDELVTALMEDKTPMDELLEQLPGPPNCELLYGPDALKVT